MHGFYLGRVKISGTVVSVKEEEPIREVFRSEAEAEEVKNRRKSLFKKSSREEIEKGGENK